MEGLKGQKEPIGGIAYMRHSLEFPDCVEIFRRKNREMGRPRRKWWEAVKEGLDDKRDINWKNFVKGRKQWKTLAQQRSRSSLVSL